MTTNKPDRLIGSVQELEAALEAPHRDGTSSWADAVHVALGKLTDAIQREVQGAEQSKKDIGEINPDFRNAPTADRHVEMTREVMIQLGESVHQLRADIRLARATHNVEIPHLRIRGREIVNAIDKVRQEDNRFLLETFNSNPGAGD